MNDLNFFDSYVEKKEFKISKKFIFAILAGLACFCFFSYGIRNQIKINKLRSHINTLKTVAEDPNTIKRVEYLKEQEEEVNRFKVEVYRIKDLSDAIERENSIDDDLLRMISYSMPDSIFLNTLNISHGEIYIGGISKDKWSIADFSKGIEYIENVDQVFISNITQEEEHYKFDLNIGLKDVIENGKD